MIRLDTTISSVEEAVQEVLARKTVQGVPAGQPAGDGKNAARFSDGTAADSPPASLSGLSERSGSESVHVDLSGAGKAMALGGAHGRRTHRNADIDDTDLPNEIKDLLKRIREIREELRQKQAELREVMADTRMRPEQRKMRVAMLQSEIMALTAALMLSSQALARLINDLKGAQQLTDEQAMLAGMLIMA